MNRLRRILDQLDLGPVEILCVISIVLIGLMLIYMEWVGAPCWGANCQNAPYPQGGGQ